jgi:hypothetical protein
MSTPWSEQQQQQQREKQREKQQQERQWCSCFYAVRQCSSGLCSPSLFSACSQQHWQLSLSTPWSKQQQRQRQQQQQRKKLQQRHWCAAAQ